LIELASISIIPHCFPNNRCWS